MGPNIVFSSHYGKFFFISDYRLNPTLRKECRMDITKFCQDIIDRAIPDHDMSGQVILCLRKHFVKKVSICLLSFRLKLHMFPFSAMEAWQRTLDTISCLFKNF